VSLNQIFYRPAEQPEQTWWWWPKRRETVNGCADMQRPPRRRTARPAHLGGDYQMKDLSPQIRDAIEPLKVGEPSQPIATGDGVLIVMVCRATPNNLPDRDRVEQMLMGERLSMLARRHLRDLRLSPSWTSAYDQSAGTAAARPRALTMVTRPASAAIALWRIARGRVAAPLLSRSHEAGAPGETHRLDIRSLPSRAAGRGQAFTNALPVLKLSRRVTGGPAGQRRRTRRWSSRAIDRALPWSEGSALASYLRAQVRAVRRGLPDPGHRISARPLV
jgi:hypothetical protein